ncbi:MAG: hypothetical protein ACK5Q5_24615 [Planctomycetaceae bacterium]
MPEMSKIESQPSTGTRSTNRCLELRPVLERLGIKPLLIGVGRVVIGSRASGGLTLNVEGLAPEHVEIEFDGNRARLRVVSPLTWLNDGPVREATLRQGDLLTLGPIEFQVGIVDVPAPPPPPAPVTVKQPRTPANRSGTNESLPAESRRPAESAPKATPSPASPTIASKSEVRPSVAPKSPPKPSLSQPKQPASGPPKPDESTPVQPLLDEAVAAQHLRRDLSRVEQEAAWHRAHLQTHPVVEPHTQDSAPEIPSPAADQPTPPAPAHEAAALAERERQLREQEDAFHRAVAESQQARHRQSAEQAALHQEQQRLAERQATLTLREQQLAAEYETLHAEKQALEMDVAKFATEQAESLPLRHEALALRSQLDVEQAELAQREQRLVEQQAEFDSAVAALDLDREQTRRASEVALREAAQLRQRLERQQAELQNRAQQLATEEEQLRKLTGDCDTRELQLEEKQRQQASTQREREAALNRREAALRGREAAIKAGQDDLDTRRGQLQANEEVALQTREELESLREEAQRMQADAERQLRDIEANRQRLNKRNAALAERTTQLDTEWERQSRERAEFEQSLAEMRARSDSLDHRDAEHQQLLIEVAELRRLQLESRNYEKIGGDQAQIQALHSAESQTTSAHGQELAEQRQQFEQERAAWNEEVAAAEAALAAERSRLEQWNLELGQRLDSLAEQSAAGEAIPSVQTPELPSAELDDRIAQLQTHEEALSVAVAELEQRRDELTEWEARLQTQSDELSARQEPVASGTADALPTELEHDADELRAAIAKLTSERDQFQTELQSALETQQAIEEEFRWLQAEADRTAAEREELRQGRAELDRQAAELDAVREKLADKEHQSQSQRDQYREQQMELEALRQELAEERRHLTQLRAQNDVDQADIDPAPALSKRLTPSDIFADESSESTELDQEDHERNDPVRSSANVWFNGTASETHEPMADDTDREDRPAQVPAGSLSEIFESPEEALGPMRHSESLDEDDHSADVVETTRRAAPGMASTPSQTTSAEKGESDAGIRSQLAMLFGISREQLDETETRHHDDLEPANSSSLDDEEAQAVARERELAGQLKQAARDIGEQAKSKPSQVSDHDDHPEIEDSVAAYMQRLLAKSALSDSSVVDKVEPAAEVRQPAESAASRNTDELPSHLDQDEYGEDQVSDEATTAATQSRGGRRLDRQEREEIRANIDSMRQIANLSARSAVARHYASKLDVTRKVKMLLVGTAAGVSVLLLSAELWTRNSYRLPGICAAVVAIIAGLELARTSIQMKRVQQIAGTSADDKPSEE